MKKCCIWIVSMLLLCGCAINVPLVTEPTEDPVASTQATLPTEPAPLPVEALVAFPDSFAGCTGVAMLGKNILVSYETGWQLLSGVNLIPIAELEKTLPSLDSSLVQIRETGVAVYDASTHSIYFLDAFLEEWGNYQLGELEASSLCLSSDWSTLYYSGENGVFALDLNTGISRTLTDIYTDLTLERTVQKDKVLCCVDNGNVFYLSTTTGEMLVENSDILQVTADGDWFFGQWNHEPMKEWIFWQEDYQLWTLWPIEEEAQICPVLKNGGLVFLSKYGTKCKLSFFDLETGVMKDQIQLPGEPQWIQGDGASIWICVADSLYHWWPELGEQEDTEFYIQKHQSSDSPDEAGLEQIRQQTQQMLDAYGVEILIWQDAAALMPENSAFVPEYMTQMYEKTLAELDSLLQQFPKEMLLGMADWTQSGRVKILLVRELLDNSYPLVATQGMQFYENGDMYLVLQTGGSVTAAFYHQLAHVMETAILSGSTAYYEWDTLNPKGFSYDNDYAKNALREDSKYLEGANRYFIDLYSMSFPKEDRCRIFEYAMQPGNEEYFQSTAMQKKLKRVCKGIREAFALTGEDYLWEQYLNT